MGAQVVLGFPVGNDVKLIPPDSRNAKRKGVSSVTRRKQCFSTFRRAASAGIGVARVGGMEALSDEEFDVILGEALDLLPAGVTEQLDNVALFVEDRPENGDRHLLGLYEGTPIGERGIAGFEMPDNIFIYRDNLIDFAEDRDHLREEIVITIVHEIAHFYGLDDDRLHELGWG